MEVINLSKESENTVEEVKKDKKQSSTETKQNKAKKTAQTKVQKTEDKPKKKVNLSRDETIKVISNVDGVLFYRSPNGMVSFEIDEYGGYDYVELSTLVSMRNGNRRFFSENWIIVDDGDDYTAQDVYEFLRVDQYYKNVFSPEKIDKLFSFTPGRIQKIVSGYSPSLKQTIFNIAKKKHQNGKLDSVTKIKAIEAATGMLLDE